MRATLGGSDDAARLIALLRKAETYFGQDPRDGNGLFAPFERLAAELRDVRGLCVGAGIDPEFLPHVFELFRQAEGGTTRNTGGLGLGLAIVQRAVEAHRGLVLVDSAPGAGTTFTIFLPAKMMAEDAA